MYWLTASSIGSTFIGTVISRSDDGIHWTKVSRCDADHTHPFVSKIDPIRNVSCGYGRAASILFNERGGEHFMIWGAGTLNMARSVNRSLVDWVTVKQAWLAGLPERGAWVNPGGPPTKLSDGSAFNHCSQSERSRVACPKSSSRCTIRGSRTWSHCSVVLRCCRLLVPAR